MLVSLLISDYLNQTGYRVISNPVSLFDGNSSSTLTLTGTWPVGRTGRLKITISSTTGHTDCIGTITIGSETLAFAQAGTKLTTNGLTASPIITTANLDCHIHVVVIDTVGQPIYEETALELDCRFQDTQKAFQDPTGKWTNSSAIVYTDEDSCNIGTTFSYGGYDYNIAQVSIMTDLDGSEEGRKLYLTGKTLSPDRAIEVEEGAEMLTRYMTRATYDTDEDGIVDTAEGIREVDDFPTSPKKGDLVLKDGELYICTGT